MIFELFGNTAKTMILFLKFRMFSSFWVMNAIAKC